MEIKGEKIHKELSDKVTDIIPYVLKKIVQSNAENKTKKTHSVFDSSLSDKITLEDYLMRIRKHSDLELNTLVCSFILIDKLINTHRIILSTKNVHKILLSGILISIKFMEDVIYKQNDYAKIGGVSLSSLSAIETAFLKIIDYKIVISHDVFEQYYTKICTF
jgi:ATP-dependent 26S proteasome regulatory subunit